MQTQPAAATVRTPSWIAALIAILAALAFVYYSLFAYCYSQWLTPDYSHGFLVPAFAIYLAWMRKGRMPTEFAWPDPRGLLLIVAGSILFALGMYNYAKEWTQGFSLVLNLLGAAVLLGGPGAFRWLWPSVAFLFFMFPLPQPLQNALGWPLQNVAARASEFALQTLGYPTIREGKILHCQDHVLEVERACNGLSMLLTFITLSVGMVIVVRRPWVDRVIILLSAAPIAILSNVVRITLTGVLYNEGGKELGDRIFHDFAGWMMMPLALGMLLVVLKLLDWVLQDDLGKASREEVIKNVTSKPAYLFMPAFEQAQANAGKAKPPPPQRTPR